MKQKIKNICLTVIFIGVLCSVIWLLDRVMERKYSYSKYADFYQQEQDFDVLFFGTSHVINAIYPMELWEDYGIVSYNMANHSETICTNYWQLVYALQYTTPKIVVIDLYAIDGEGKANLKYMHNLTDTMPLSWTKFRMITDLLSQEEWAEYLFELSIYHSRWNDLTSDDLHPETSTEKGAELRTEVVIDTAPTVIAREQYEEHETANEEYLQKIIDLCKQKNIEVILTYLPYSEPEDHQLVANRGYVIAEENDIPYLNFLYEDFSLNYATDCADIGSHLNVSGARKVTDYIGQYITQNYDIPDRREDADYAFWEEDYQEYTQFKIDTLNEQEDLWSYLALLYDKNLETTIYATTDSMIYQDVEIMELLNNIDSLGNLNYETIEGYEGNFYVDVTNKQTGEVVSSRKYTRVGDDAYDRYE